MAEQQPTWNILSTMLAEVPHDEVRQRQEAEVRKHLASPHPSRPPIIEEIARVRAEG